MSKISVHFVCLGNICRSPMAEAVFRHLVEQAGLSDHFDIHSSGIGGWHVGERPHEGTRTVLEDHGINIGGKRAQRLDVNDVADADYMIAMDTSNAADVHEMFGREIPLLMEFAADGIPMDVPDPYYSGNFEYVYRLVRAGCEGLLNQIGQEQEL